MRLPKTTTIDGVQYRVTPVGSETGGLFLFRVMRAGAGLMSGLKIKGGVLVDLDMSGGIVQALQSMTPQDFAWSMDVLKESTQIGIVDVKGDGRTTWVPLSQEYSHHFADNYAAMLEWACFAVEANGFPSFFAGLVKKLARPKAPSPSASPPAADGSPHASSSMPG